MRPKKYHKKDHQIDRNQIDPNALSVIHTLQQAGYSAYLVGGGVRDLLMGITPKDFDISTSARPEEIKDIFQRQCLLIGRRFRLAHIRFGRKILEVSTFRAGDTESSSIIVRDNIWGSEEEDVKRRDFTINALCYDPEHEIILDYFGGVGDIKHKVLKTIGDPTIRFKQDPVRMIRLLKFQARFGFDCDKKTKSALKACKNEIVKSAQARLLEEMFKMLESGKSAPFFHSLTTEGFLKLLFPCFQHFFSGPSQKIALSYLHALDTIVSRKKTDRAVLLSSIIFPILEQELQTLIADRQYVLPMSEIQHLTHTLMRGINTSSFIHFPRKLLGSIFSIIIDQFRLTPIKKQPKFHSRFRSREEFSLAVDFLKIRTLVDPSLKTTLQQWEDKRHV